MITEVLMGPGSFTIPFRVDAPKGKLWSTVLPVTEAGGGHIVITPQHTDPAEIGDSGMLSAARYTGPVLRCGISNGKFKAEGVGMEYHLGDDLMGDRYTSAVALSSDVLTDCVTALLPPSGGITTGTVTNTGYTHTGTYYYDTPRDALNTMLADINAERRINPDGTLDAGANSDLFNIDDADITVLVTRLDSGSDPSYKAVPTATLASHVDARTHASRAVLISSTGSGSGSVIASANQSPAMAGKDIHGNTLVRTLLYDSDPDGSVNQYLATELAEYRLTSETNLSTGYWQLSGGGFNVGDAFWVWDPPAFVDTANQIDYRGDTIFPAKMRLISASWPLIEGMGVAFRADDGTYLDLTEWINWEAQEESIGLGLQGSDLGTRIPGATTLIVRDFVAVTGGC